MIGFRGRRQARGERCDRAFFDDLYGPHADLVGADDVVMQRIPDEEYLVGREARTLEHVAEEVGIRFTGARGLGTRPVIEDAVQLMPRNEWIEEVVVDVGGDRKIQAVP